MRLSPVFHSLVLVSRKLASPARNCSTQAGSSKRTCWKQTVENILGMEVLSTTWQMCHGLLSKRGRRDIRTQAALTATEKLPSIMPPSSGFQNAPPLKRGPQFIMQHPSRVHMTPLGQRLIYLPCMQERACQDQVWKVWLLLQVPFMQRATLLLSSTAENAGRRRDYIRTGSDSIANALFAKPDRYSLQTPTQSSSQYSVSEI